MENIHIVEVLWNDDWTDYTTHIPDLRELVEGNHMRIGRKQTGGNWMVIGAFNTRKEAYDFSNKYDYLMRDKVKR